MSSGARRPLVAGNWKMHKTVAETRALIREILGAVVPHDLDVAIAPPYTALAAAQQELAGSPAPG